MSSPRHPLRPAAVLLALALLPLALPAAADGKGRGWLLEISGGGMSLAPAELNAAVEADNGLQSLQYDHYLEFLRASRRIRGWNSLADGARGRVKAGWCLSARLRHGLGGSLSLSAGVRILRGGGKRNLFREYTRDLGAGDLYVETLACNPYQLGVRGIWPSLGVHFRRSIRRRLSAEGFAAVGPLFAGVTRRSTWTTAWDMRGSGYVWPVFRDAGAVSERGTGTGVGMELGGRIGRRLGSRLEAFLEGGYAWLKVNSLSGSGSETRAGQEETWSGRWLTRSETVTAPWEALPVRYPTCRPRAGAADDPFRLDLSGWQLRLGLSWGL